MQITRQRLLPLATLSAAFLLSGCFEPASTPKIPTVELEVSVDGGRILGISDNGNLKQYHGIPYVAPPTGDRRWAPPGPLIPWDGVLDASTPGIDCSQPVGPEGSFFGGAADFAQGEDCLRLNVWTRAETQADRLPVMVWIHGGGLTTGSGASYPGETLTSKGVVLVTVNYRLGPFGFLAHPELSARYGVSGNQGLRDQIAALRWVKDNIALFGGDPDNVTIFGESAGSYSMSLLQASPVAKGLFHRVIGESGAAFQPMWHLNKATSYAMSAEELGSQFGAALAGEDGEASLAGLRQRSSAEVMAAFQSDPAFSNYDSLAIVDGEVIPDEVASIFAAGEQADVPVLIGSNADEGTAFIDYFTPGFGEGQDGFKAYARATIPEADDTLELLYPATDAEEAVTSWGHLFADQLFTYPMRAWARSMSSVDSPAYLYWFTWQPPIPEREKYRSFHAAEIAYVFGSLDGFNATPTEADRQFSDTLSDVWVQFAKTGNPNGAGIAEWPAFSATNEAYMELGPTIRSGENLKLPQMSLIEQAWAERRDSASTGGQD
jgi:para-nitrobenzyl esterase